MNKDKLMWGTRCRHHGSKPNGTCLRFKQPNGLQGACVFCHKELEGVIDQDELYAQYLTPHKPKKTPEEKAKGASLASARWNKRNKERVAEYQKTYQSKPEIRKMNNAKTLQKYHSMTPEEKLIHNQQKYRDCKARSGTIPYRDQIALMTPEEKVALEESKREARNEYARLRYASLTPEERLHLKQKHKEYRDNVKARKEEANRAQYD